MRIFTILSVVAFFGIAAMEIVLNIQLDQNCTGYLKRAADANSIETASKELAVAIKYCEENKLTEGYTSVVYKTPDEDIEFWYNNLVTCQKELQSVDSTTSSLEKSNILLKLRETLLDDGKEGSTVTCPWGLSRYPNNGLYSILLTVSCICAIAGVCWVTAKY